MVTLVATPQPDNVPPRVRLDLDTTDSAQFFSDLTIYRDGKKIREQPFLGGTVAVAFDYEAPFGVPVTYSADGETVAASSSFSTAWPNLTGWTTVSGFPGVSGGLLIGTPPSYAGTVNRTLSLPAQGRLTLNAPIQVAPTSGSGAGISIGAGLRVQRAWPTTGTLIYFNGATKIVSHASGPLVVTWGTDGLTITTAAGSTTMPGSYDTSSNVLQVGIGNGAAVPGFSIESTGVGTPFSTNTDTDTLVVDETWLIHPSQPALSIPIDVGPQPTGPKLRFIEASSGESKTSAAQSTVHRPIGRRRPVVITAGPREADEWTLTVGAPTLAQKNSVRALVDDQTPLLLRSPLGLSQDLPDDWYSVGDVEISRVLRPSLNEMTLIKLPLTPVDEPIVRQGALWTWGNVLTTYATWSDVLAGNDTWLDLIAGPSS